MRRCSSWPATSFGDSRAVTGPPRCTWTPSGACSGTPRRVRDDAGMAPPPEAPSAAKRPQRSSHSPRGELRRAELLARVVADVAANGLVGFSLRRAARAAGATHKVLLYHFGSGDDLLRAALNELREARISAAVAGSADAKSLAEQVEAVWAALVAEADARRVLDQATGLAMYDPDRYADLGRDATNQYLPGLVGLCPQTWPPHRREGVATAILATLRGLLLDLVITNDSSRVDSARAALTRWLEAEQART